MEIFQSDPFAACDTEARSEVLECNHQTAHGEIGKNDIRGHHGKEHNLEADVKLPLFGLPTLSSALNIMVNLYGEEALVAMLDDEEAAMHDLKLYLDGLREDQIIYLNPCEGMSIEKALEISGGKRIVLCEAVDAPELK